MPVAEAEVLTQPDALPLIRETVARLLGQAGQAHPPVDLIKVARVQGITAVRNGKLRNSLGVLRDGPDGFTVTLSSRDPAKSRFTLAHEIAHTLLLHSKHSTVVLGERKTKLPHQKLERLCDTIAAEILLPYEMFREAVDEERLTIEAILRLCGRFDASLQSTARRAGDLTNQAAQVVCWKKSGGGHLTPMLRTGRPFFAVNAWLALTDESSPAVRAYLGSERADGRETGLVTAPNAIYHHQAQGFLRGDARYVLSVITAAGG
jgi:IrrE N-terminal-like domain